MKIVFIFSVFMAFIFGLVSDDKPAYILYNAEGKEVKYSKMIDKLADADIVLFGEQHTNPICHWLEYEVLNDLYQVKKDGLVVGAEMFETDNQLLLNEMLAGKYDSKKFEEEAKLWKNYQTDYKPLVEFCKTNKLPFIGTNIPRRYANMVFKGGFVVLDSLTPEAKSLIADLPVPYDPELKCYKDMIEMGKEMGGHSNENFPKAQAIKDATMAKFIMKNWQKGKLFLHFEGAYHSDNYQGMVWYLKKINPDLKILTISSIEQKEINDLEKDNLNKADYIIVIPENMTQTSR
ncbi:MAG: ChaN family lipoprotein [Bacteroidales bacterium]